MNMKRKLNIEEKLHTIEEMNRKHFSLTTHDEKKYFADIIFH